MLEARTGWMVAVCMALLVSCRVPRGQDLERAPYPDEQAAIERTLLELLDAAARKDFARMESFHLYGPKFTKWDSKGAARLDAEAMRKSERAGIEPLDAIRIGVEDLRIDVFGEVAVATLLLPFEASAGGQTVRAKSRATLVWVKTGAGWKIAHEHISAAPAGP